MSNFDSFAFAGHGTSEKTGGYDPGAVGGGYVENDLARKIQAAAKNYLKSTGLNIHYDENNYTDYDLAGNTYKFKCGIVIHINSANGASGVECYVPCGESHIETDITLCSEISKLLGIPNRGVKSRGYDSENYYNRTNGSKVGESDYYGEIRDAWSRGISLCILEVGFIQADGKKINDRINELGYLVAKYIATNCDKKLVEPATVKPTATTNNTSGKMYRVVTGSFKDKANAEARVKELKAKGFDSFIL